MVVDASVLHPALLKPGGKAARVLQAGGSLAAPQHVVLEVASSLRSTVARGECAPEHAATALQRLHRLPMTRYPLEPLVDRAWELRDNLTPYDAAYVALAERLGVPLATADGGIAAAPRLRCEVLLVEL